MPAGAKRYRITIERLKTDAEGVTRAASGKIDHTSADNWTTHATRWAEMIEPGGREWQQEGQVRSESTHLVMVDWDSGTKTTTSEMRVSWNDGGTTRHLDITRVGGKARRSGQARWELVIECKEHS